MFKTSRRAMLAGAAAAAGLPRFAIAQAREKIRIGVPTKTYWPTIVCETALRQKLFDKEGIDAELTIYRGGAEGFEAIAAGAADLILNSSSSVAAGLKKGVNVKCVANGSNGYYGWYLVVKPDSKVTKVEDLAGKKVGITSAGSGSDILALWTVAERKVEFTRVPLGGGGLVPNLLLRQHRRHGPLLAAHLQGDAGQGGALDHRLRRRGAGALDRRAGSPPTRSSRIARPPCRRR